MLNFLLAIIVGAYEKVQNDMEESRVENDIFTDLYYILRESFLSFRHRWPPRHAIIFQLQRLDADFIKYTDLLWEDGFETKEKAKTFYDFYWKIMPHDHAETSAHQIS